MTEGHRILLVEDEPALQRLISQILSNWGHKCVTCTSCAEAREQFVPGRFACSLIDLGLPDGSGMDLLLEFSRDDPQMVNMVLTGDLSAESVIDTMRRGAFDYLTKPMSASALEPAIMRALTHHDAVRQRATLTQLLIEERAQLDAKVEATTQDLREYAASCEAVNARLHGLLRLTQISSSGLHTDEDLFRRVFREIVKFVPLRCLALCDGVTGAFLAAYTLDTGELVVSEVDGDEGWTDVGPSASPADWRALVESRIERHIELDPVAFGVFSYTHALENQATCVVGMLFESGFTIGSGDREFLGMCAHHVASEWQFSQLLQHAAMHASLGNIALDLTRSFAQSLTAIQVATDFLSETVDSEEAIEGLSIIPDNMNLLRGLIRDFRNLSLHPRDGVGTVPLARLIDQALLMLAVTIQNHNVRIIKEYETNSECVLLNETVLARTFLDLISSAIRATSAGGRILLRLCDRGQDHILFEIAVDDLSSNGRDGGGGQPFSMLARGHPSFLLAQRTIHSCAGKLEIDSAEGSRVSVRVVLPRDATRSAATKGTSA